MNAKFALLFCLALAPAQFAGCAESAYSQACATCFSNATSIVAQQDCVERMGEAMAMCYSQQYPMMAAAGVGDECPEINMCLAENSACVAGSMAGSESGICGNAGIYSCMRGLDLCIESANEACAPRGEQVVADGVRRSSESLCPCIGWLALVGGALLICRK